jgi:hypothetical protein
MIDAVLSPRRLAMKIVLVAIVLVVLLVASGVLKVEFWAGSSAAPATRQAPTTRIDMRSATVRDFVAVADAATAASDDLDQAQLNGLLTRYESDRDAAALAAIDRAMPGFSHRVDRRIRKLSRRVASVGVTTAVGHQCRRTTLTFLNRQRVVFARFALQVKRDGATSPAVDRFIRALQRSHVSYGDALRTCTAKASRRDREALEPLLSG